MERLTDNLTICSKWLKKLFYKKTEIQKMRISVFHLVILFLIIIIAFVDYFVKLVGVVAHNTIGTD